MDGKPETELDSFLRNLVGESKQEPERSPERPRPRGDREKVTPEGGGASETKGAGGVRESTTRRVLAEIASLSNEADRYRMLEKKLWENVDNLVPAVMSFSDWSKGLRELREANQAAEKASGQSVDDPLGAIRIFLAGAN